MNTLSALAPVKLDNAIKSLISSFEGSKAYSMYKDGENYYNSENTVIMARKQMVYLQDANGNPYLVEDPYKSNNKMASGFYKIHVDQKVNYSLGKPVYYNQTNEDSTFEDTLGDNFQETLRQTAKDAATYCRGWALVNVNEAGEFEVLHIPMNEVVPVYKPMNGKELEYAIRYYTVQAMNKASEYKDVIQAEVWDSEQVTIYRQDPDTLLYGLVVEKGVQNPRSHFSKNKKYGEKIAESKGIGWGKVPLIPLYNNDKELYDLQQIKKFVDVYDKGQSDFANNLEDFQDIYWTIKGYSGTNVNAFLEDIRKYKAIPVEENGDVQANTVQIPYEARIAELENLEKAIYKFGMAVDVQGIQGGTITNVHIKAMFANLDLKANDFEQQIKNFIYRLLYFVNFFLKQGSGKEIALEDVLFERSLIINEVEVLKANAEQQGNISDETRLDEHPWVTNAKEEIQKMKDEQGSIQIVEPVIEDGQT